MTEKQKIIDAQSKMEWTREKGSGRKYCDKCNGELFSIVAGISGVTYTCAECSTETWEENKDYEG